MKYQMEITVKQSQGICTYPVLVPPKTFIKMREFPIVPKVRMIIEDELGEFWLNRITIKKDNQVILKLSDIRIYEYLDKSKYLEKLEKTTKKLNDCGWVEK